MLTSRVKPIIVEAFARLEAATESSSVASKLLSSALEAAREDEKRHRRMGASYYPAGTYKHSELTAAKYHVCRQYGLAGREPIRAIVTYLEAATMRRDTLYCRALAQYIAENPQQSGQPVDMSDVLEIDYKDHIVGPQA
jgi:hypothetical protein